MNCDPGFLYKLHKKKKMFCEIVKTNIVLKYTCRYNRESTERAFFFFWGWGSEESVDCDFKMYKKTTFTRPALEKFRILRTCTEVIAGTIETSSLAIGENF